MKKIRRKVVKGWPCGGHANSNWYNVKLECGHNTVAVLKYPKAPTYDYILPKTCECRECSNNQMVI